MDYLKSKANAANPRGVFGETLPNDIAGSSSSDSKVPAPPPPPTRPPPPPPRRTYAPPPPPTRRTYAPPPPFEVERKLDTSLPPPAGFQVISPPPPPTIRGFKVAPPPQNSYPAPPVNYPTERPSPNIRPPQVSKGLQSFRLVGGPVINTTDSIGFYKVPIGSKVYDLQLELDKLQKTMWDEIGHIEVLQGRLDNIPASIEEKQGNVELYKEQIERLKREKEETHQRFLSALPRSNEPAGRIARMLEEENEQDQKKLDKRIQRWQTLLQEAITELASLTKFKSSDEDELDVITESLVMHDEQRTRLEEALNRCRGTKLMPYRDPKAEIERIKLNLSRQWASTSVERYYSRATQRMYQSTEA